jgi:tRNA(Ile2) C34 agmatinyltransferase TiaS
MQTPKNRSRVIRGHEDPLPVFLEPMKTVARAKKPACPYCGASASTVSRVVGSARYRRCQSCGRSFFTREVAMP